MQNVPPYSRGRPARGHLWLGLVAAIVPSPAAAHHLMGGALPQTFLQGLLSGLGHPIIGPDHLAFIIALGIAASQTRGGLGVIAAFAAFSTLGVLVHVAQLNVPMVEILIPLTVMLAGAGLIWRSGMTQPAWFGFAVCAGLIHGYAFGETIVGAESGPLGAYLLGIAIAMSATAGIVMRLARRVLAPEVASAGSLRTAGLALGGIGLVLLASSLV